MVVKGNDADWRCWSRMARSVSKPKGNRKVIPRTDFGNEKCAI